MSREETLRARKERLQNVADWWFKKMGLERIPVIFAAWPFQSKTKDGRRSRFAAAEFVFPLPHINVCLLNDKEMRDFLVAQYRRAPTRIGDATPREESILEELRHYWQYKRNPDTMKVSPSVENNIESYRVNLMELEAKTLAHEDYLEWLAFSKLNGLKDDSIWEDHTEQSSTS